MAIKDLECPYCDHQFDHDEVSDSNPGQDERLVIECPECDKKFTTTSYWSLNFMDCEKADCLNEIIPHNWSPSTAAAFSTRYRMLTEKYADLTCDNHLHIPWQIHDFGFRSAPGCEAAALTGMAHLIVHKGTDDLLGLRVARRVYGSKNSDPMAIGGSVPATEHSIAMLYGQENEKDYLIEMLKRHPTGYLSVVSDTWNLFRLITQYLTDPEVFALIMGRSVKLVVRPDSGDPVKIACGDENAPAGSPESLGVIRLLADIFGATTNEKGYKLLNEKIGCIYGDGIYLERAERIFQRLMDMKFASSNIVFGIGSILKNHGRDDQGWAFKMIYALINGKDHNLVKDPATDRKKKSHTGHVLLEYDAARKKFVTHDQVSDYAAQGGELKSYFKNGQIVKFDDFDTVRETYERTYANYKESLKIA